MPNTIVIAKHNVIGGTPLVMHELHLGFTGREQYSRLAEWLSVNPGTPGGHAELSGLAKGADGCTGVLTYTEVGKLYRLYPRLLAHRMSDATGLMFTAIPGTLELPRDRPVPTPLACPAIKVTPPDGPALAPAPPAPWTLPPLGGGHLRSGAARGPHP